MAQKYKIYINESLLILCSTDYKVAQDYFQYFDLVVRYTGNKKSLFNYIDHCEKNKSPKKVVIYSDHFKSLKNDFLSLYTIVEASGGIVTNELDEILFIYRRKKWDLPKGKIDAGEKKKAAAIREVMEETGIVEVQIVEKIGITNHTYNCKGNKRCIKKSHWYLMKTHKQKLIPQLEEDIEKAIWLTLPNFYMNKYDAYTSISDILNTYENNQN